MGRIVSWFKGLSATNQRLIIGIPVLISLYYLMSPYENCRRTGLPIEMCKERTHW